MPTQTLLMKAGDVGEGCKILVNRQAERGHTDQKCEGENPQESGNCGPIHQQKLHPFKEYVIILWEVPLTETPIQIDRNFGGFPLGNGCDSGENDFGGWTPEGLRIQYNRIPVG